MTELIHVICKIWFVNKHAIALQINVLFWMSYILNEYAKMAINVGHKLKKMKQTANK